MTQLVKDRDNLGVTFADPTKPLDTTRVKQVSETKRIQGIAVDASVLEVVGLRQAEIAPGVKETLTCRVIIKGAIVNHAKVRELTSDVLAYAQTVVGENGFVGFDPQTSPSY